MTIDAFVKPRAAVVHLHRILMRFMDQKRLTPYTRPEMGYFSFFETPAVFFPQAIRIKNDAREKTIDIQ